MWVFVKRDLELHFSMLEKPEQGSDHDDTSTLAAQQVIAVELFKVRVNPCSAWCWAQRCEYPKFRGVVPAVVVYIQFLSTR
jgi:hypothetical protein